MEKRGEKSLIMRESFSIAFVGLGNRGKDTYLPAFAKFGNKVNIVALAEPIDEKRQEAAKRYGVPPERCFKTGEELFAYPRMADAACIATMDQQHVPQAIAALEKGYDLLLEKPVSPSLEECRRLQSIARKRNGKIMVCHVLRYTSFYLKAKELLEAGIIGDVVTIHAIENVGYWHQAHSFVRGNWRNSETTSPMILQKCCHDLDLYLWLADKKSKSVSSFGTNYFFNSAHAPKGSTSRCMDGCLAKTNCPFDAEKIYISNERTGIDAGHDGWPNEVLALHPTRASIYEAIRTGPYGRCVFACDNNVVDHQIVNVEMTDGSTLSLTMSAFTEQNTRFAKFMGTEGELCTNFGDGTITVTRFGTPQKTFRVDLEEGHGGGDTGIVREFVNIMCGGTPSRSVTSLDTSLESHYIALGAEKSRLEGGTAIEIASLS